MVGIPTKVGDVTAGWLAEVTGLDGDLSKFGIADKAVHGSAQHWVENTEKFSALTAEERKTVGTPEEWYQLYVMDFLLGQTDRHRMNLLVDKEPGPDGVRRMHAIDNTLTFPRISPEPGRAGVKGLRMVGHGAHGMAASAEERARILEKLNDTDWDDVLEGIGAKAREAFMQRLEFVKRHVEANTLHLPIKYSTAQWRD